MENLKNKTIAEIVTEDNGTARVFKKYNLDFCCGGGKTIENACLQANVNVDAVINDLLNTNSSSYANANLNFKDWDPGFLADYIVNVHHNYVKENLSIINEFASKVAKVHGEHASETIEIDNLFTQLSNELLDHMVKEETILFPAIKQLNNSQEQIDQSIIDLLEDEHEIAGTIAKKITELSNNFTPPEWGCNTFKALYHLLDEFISDLYQHIHLENNILFNKINS